MHANYTHMQHALSLFHCSPLFHTLSLFNVHVPKVLREKNPFVHEAKLSQF